jgi:hypothetical protein
MIIQQCAECAMKGKKVYCKCCTLRADYFRIQGYGNSKMASKPYGNQLEPIIKAYTWNDVIEYIISRFFNNYSRTELNINCEKDFAFVEEKPIVQGKTDLMGFKVYLIDRDNRNLNDRNLHDLTSNITQAGT